ncbi:MAG: UvrD-helicase domain-containing protein, partial [Oscillospiraceae bacterium]|nr:UvrD-helicase domain-containing protein [Oscillospiraceae bacterium]
MNDRQREAVFAIEGPVLVLAGAGSGKTTVLVDRIANMILFGKGWNKPDDMLTEEERGFLECYDGDHDPFEVDILRDIVAVDPVKPWSILAITFTNKAAGELKSRLSSMLGADGELVRASTFHSACVRILRREITALGYTQGFTIYDTDDTKRLIKDCVKTLDLEPKRFPERIVMAHISDAKNDLIDADSYAAKAGSDYFTMTVAQIYKLYQERLKASDALDFDDIIMLTVKLFSEHPEVLDHYQNLYRYIMVDEYQDTNHAQYVLVSLLAEKYGNLCVVGDDDQSIYSFRGATIRNILSFEDQFSDCVTIKLEQNYRSTQNILDAANAVIGNNSGRRPKALWTERDGGELITVYCADDERAEAKYVTDTIEDMVSKGRDYSDFAVLYRMNAQSNSIEHAFRVSKIPYRIIGGLRFYDRREIKDILAYMSVLADPHDMVRFKRIVNLPKRGIGETTAASIEEISYVVGDDPIRIMADADGYAPLVRKASLLKKTAAMFEALREDAEEMRPDELIDRIMAVTGYGEMLKEEGDEGITRFENIAELKSNIQLYTDHCEDTGSEPTLAGFLEEAALYSSADDADDDQPSVNMMTIHSAKGLEFPVVFLVGAEENIFPSQRARADTLQLEEERRLAYVAITRAKDKLFITHARTRLLMGMTHYDPRTRFIREIGPDLLEELPPPFKDPRPASSAGDGHMPGMHTIQGMRKRPAAGEDTYIVADFTVGERVVHPKFGGGTILTVKPIGDDQMVDVAFDTI